MDKTDEITLPSTLSGTYEIRLYPEQPDLRGGDRVINEIKF